MLTARGGVGARILCLNTGADDDLAKRFDLDELEARVRALARRVRGSATAAVEFCGLCAAADSGAVYRRGEPMERTARETALLRALLARPGHAVAKQRLSDLVFAGEAAVQAAATEVGGVCRLRKKLAGSATQLVSPRGLGLPASRRLGVQVLAKGTA